MPPRTRTRTPEEWIFGLSFHIEADTRRFIAAVYEMPIEFVAAFEYERDVLANALIAGGKVRGMDTARTYASEILGRLVWMKTIKGTESESGHETEDGTAPLASCQRDGAQSA